MGLKLDIFGDFEKAGHRFVEGFEKIIVKAVRRSIATAATRLRTQANRAVRNHYNRLKVSDLNREWFFTSKSLKGSKLSDLTEMKAVFSVRDKPVSLIRLATRKTPPQQKGVKVSRRKSIKVEIERGRIVEIKGDFIAMGNNGNYQVFRRKPGSNKIAKQSAPSVHFLFNKSPFRAPIERFTGLEMQKEFIRQLKTLKP